MRPIVEFTVKRLSNGRAEASVTEDGIAVWSCSGPYLDTLRELQHYLYVTQEEGE